MVNRWKHVGSGFVSSVRNGFAPEPLEDRVNALRTLYDSTEHVHFPMPPIVYQPIRRRKQLLRLMILSC